MTLGGSIDIWRYIKTPYGEYTILWLTRQGDISTITDVSDLQAAVDAIDIYQPGRRAARKAARAARRAERAARRAAPADSTAVQLDTNSTTE